MSKGNSGKKVLLIGIALMVMMFSSIACNVEPGDGQVGGAVMDGLEAVHDAEFALKDAIGDDGPEFKVETHESPLPKLWEWAEDLAQ